MHSTVLPIWIYDRFTNQSPPFPPQMTLGSESSSHSAPGGYHQQELDYLPKVYSNSSCSNKYQREWVAWITNTNSYSSGSWQPTRSGSVREDMPESWPSRSSCCTLTYRKESHSWGLHLTDKKRKKGVLWKVTLQSDLLIINFWTDRK